MSVNHTAVREDIGHYGKLPSNLKCMSEYRIHNCIGIAQMEVKDEGFILSAIEYQAESNELNGDYRKANQYWQRYFVVSDSMNQNRFLFGLEIIIK